MTIEGQFNHNWLIKHWKLVQKMEVTRQWGCVIILIQQSEAQLPRLIKNSELHNRNQTDYNILRRCDNNFQNKTILLPACIPPAAVKICFQGTNNNSFHLYSGCISSTVLIFSCRFSIDTYIFHMLVYIVQYPEFSLGSYTDCSAYSILVVAQQIWYHYCTLFSI